MILSCGGAVAFISSSRKTLLSWGSPALRAVHGPGARRLIPHCLRVTAVPLCSLQKGKKLQNRGVLRAAGAEGLAALVVVLGRVCSPLPVVGQESAEGCLPDVGGDGARAAE